MAHRSVEHSARYRTYIGSPAWARKRVQYFVAYGKKCQACTATTGLQVHHVSYDRLGDEPLGDLVGLCETCHQLVHTYHDRVGGDLRDATTRIVEAIRAAGMAPAGKAVSGKTVRRRQSKRRVKFNKRRVPACLAKKDTCMDGAPSGSGYCWRHDNNLDGPNRDETVGRTNPATNALARRRDVSAGAQRRLNGG